MPGLQVTIMSVKFSMEGRIVLTKNLKNIKMFLMFQMIISLIFLRGRAPDKSQKLEIDL